MQSRGGGGVTSIRGGPTRLARRAGGRDAAGNAAVVVLGVGGKRDKPVLVGSGFALGRGGFGHGRGFPSSRGFPPTRAGFAGRAGFRSRGDAFAPSRGGFAPSNFATSRGGFVGFAARGGFDGGVGSGPSPAALAAMAASAEGGAQKAGLFDECWLCGSCDHRRADCPNRVSGAGQDGDATVFQRRMQCLGCRKLGHVVANCPLRGGSATVAALLPLQVGAGASPESGGGAGAGTGAAGGSRCYNCGGAHRLKDCTEEKVGGGSIFASCFVCQQPGHLARDCKRNSHGIYVSGGSCKRCGSVAHLVAHCPEPDPRGASGAPAAAQAEAVADARPRKRTAAAASGGGDELEGNVEFAAEGEREGDEGESEVLQEVARPKKKKGKKGSKYAVA